MKITKESLKQIIKEELSNVVDEANAPFSRMRQEKSPHTGTFTLQGNSRNGDLEFHHIETNLFGKGRFQQWGFGPSEIAILSKNVGKKIKDIHPQLAEYLASYMNNPTLQDPALLGEFELIRGFSWRG
tara:strand:+ start:1592 stop:1975 length:384 start_codon:yes stop_codon:yes gene_type:complete